MFRITRKKGFHMVFANGWAISVQFGPTNYCDNYGMDIAAFHHEANTECVPDSATAEIAAWDANDKWHDFEGGDQVAGYKTADEVLAFMNLIAALPPAETTEATND